MKVKIARRDESLPHQIIIMGGRTTNESAVSCNCLVVGGGGAAKPIGFIPFGEGALDEIKRLYNIPAGHNNHDVPFTVATGWLNTEIVEVK